jgi:hypothetical protein
MIEKIEIDKIKNNLLNKYGNNIIFFYWCVYIDTIKRENEKNNNIVEQFNYSLIVKDDNKSNKYNIILGSVYEYGYYENIFQSFGLLSKQESQPIITKSIFDALVIYFQNCKKTCNYGDDWIYSSADIKINDFIDQNNIDGIFKNNIYYWINDESENIAKYDTNYSNIILQANLSTFNL